MRCTTIREVLAVSIVFGVLFCAAVLPVAVGLRASEASFDEARCYLPAITQMRANFPAVDFLRDSLSASPPGYTHLLAGLSLVTGDTLRAHRVWHFAISLLGAVGLLGFVAFLARGNSMAMPAMLPAVCSGYYLKSAAQLSTDNLALVLAFAAIALVLFGSSSSRSAACAGVLGVCATYVRHVAVWTAVPIGAKALVLWWQQGFKEKAVRVRVLAWFVASSAAVALLVILLWSWSGLVPPRWSQAHGSITSAPLVYCLSLLGLFGPLFLAAAWLLGSLKLNWNDVLWGAMVGFIVFFAAETSPSYESGRWGGRFGRWPKNCRLRGTGR